MGAFCIALVGMHRLFFTELLAGDQEVDGYVEIVRHFAKHLQVWVALAVFIVGERLAADAEIHRYLELTILFLLSYDFQAKKPLIFVHANSPFFKKALDLSVTKCYYINCNSMLHIKNYRGLRFSVR